ncbi:hypothetical protein [Cryobacterium sp. BB736]|uniref:hypothetical protein n=1 Tax=Cryobacterium sp. BB736 TaxID=2746963 RepID=UPI0018770CAA
MSTEIELISDGDGLAVIGDPAAVKRFLASAGVPSKDLALQERLGTVLNAGSGAARAGSEIAANSGRWVKLTDESAKAMKVGQLMKGSSDGVSRAIATTGKGKVTKILEFAKPGSVGSMLTNPAVLAGAAGIMAQLAMQQTMDEITDYLARIDEKVDDILRAQKDAAIAEMIGVGFVIDEAMTVREHTGRISEVTWSKVQGASQTIATTQAYALRQLDALASKLEKKSSMGDLAEASKAAKETVREWLAVLARCFQLQYGLAVLELDRVFDSSPDELDRHRIGLQAARRKRREEIGRSTRRLLERMDAAVGTANDKVLFHPMKSGAVVRSGNEVAADIINFHERLGIEADRESIAAKRWTEAAAEARDTAIHVGSDGVEAVGRFGMKKVESAKGAGERFGREVAERLPLRRKDESTTTEEADQT